MRLVYLGLKLRVRLIQINLMSLGRPTRDYFHCWLKIQNISAPFDLLTFLPAGQQSEVEGWLSSLKYEIRSLDRD
jgi:hypothetical protein